jgi:hypothetical protein
MIDHIWESYPDIWITSIRSMVRGELPKNSNLLRLFCGTGNDEERAVIFSRITQERRIIEALKPWTGHIIRAACRRRHEVLLSRVIKVLKVKGKDLYTRRKQG